MLKVYKECCNNCLLSADAIVSPERRKDILNKCKKDQTHFICHKASIEGKEIVCKSFYDKLGHYSQMIQISERLGMVEQVEQPESEKLTSYREIQERKKKK